MCLLACEPTWASRVKEPQSVCAPQPTGDCLCLAGWCCLALLLHSTRYQQESVFLVLWLQLLPQLPLWFAHSQLLLHPLQLLAEEVASAAAAMPQGPADPQRTAQAALVASQVLSDHPAGVQHVSEVGLYVLLPA